MMNLQRNLLLAATCLAIWSQAAPAATLPYQGLATESTGKPKADSTYSVVFALYGKSSFDPGNNAIWWETQPLTTRKGLFSVLLGTQTALPDSVFHRDSLFLKVQFPGEIGFFVPLQAAPWAVYARSVRGFDSLAAVVKADNDSLAALARRVDGLLSTFAGVTRVADSLYFDHVNLNVRNGLGRTDTVNGLGNLIVGYNKPRGDTTDHRSGSHVLVVGDHQSFTSYGGQVVGWHNTLSGAYATISGGAGNNATGNNSAVSGGINNTASGPYSSVSGGFTNRATAGTSSVTGGESNTASGYAATVRGGMGTTVSTADGYGP